MAQEERDTPPTRKERLLEVLNDWTPLAAVLQDIVASFLEGATTLFVTDHFNHVIRAVNLEDFSVRTLAGQRSRRGHADGKEQAAKFNSPYCIVVDKATNTLFVGENTCIRRITSDGVVSTLCGDPKEGGYCEGVGVEANFQAILGAVVVGKSLFVSDYSNHCLRRIPLDDNGSSQLFAGTPGECGHLDGTHAKFDFPQGLAADCDGNLFLADSGNNAIRKITPAGVVTTVTGGEEGNRDEPLNEAEIGFPCDVAFDGRGRLLVADHDNHVIRSIDLEAGLVTTIAGQHGKQGHLDGPVSQATLSTPSAIAVDVATGNVFVSCLDDTIRCVSPDGTRAVRTVCGKANQCGHKDGLGTEASFNLPLGLTLL